MRRQKPARPPRIFCWTCTIALAIAAVDTAGASRQAESQTPATPVPASQTDPFGRETPRGTITGFSQAMSRDDLATAVRFLQLRPAQRQHTDSLARGVAREALPQGGAVTIVPGGFDQDAAGVAIAGLVRAPRRWRSPEEYSLGTRPR